MPKTKIILTVLFVFCLSCPPVRSQTMSSSEGQDISPAEVNKEYGFNLDYPPDYPIKKINGVFQPAPLTEYVYMKIEEQNKKIEELTQRVRNLEGGETQKTVSEAPSLTRLYYSLEQTDDTEIQP